MVSKAGSAKVHSITVPFSFVLLFGYKYVIYDMKVLMEMTLYIPLLVSAGLIPRGCRTHISLHDLKKNKSELDYFQGWFGK